VLASERVRTIAPALELIYLMWYAQLRETADGLLALLGWLQAGVTNSTIDRKPNLAHARESEGGGNAPDTPSSRVTPPTGRVPASAAAATGSAANLAQNGSAPPATAPRAEVEPPGRLIWGIRAAVDVCIKAAARL
jgi:hypothetical protein